MTLKTPNRKSSSLHEGGNVRDFTEEQISATRQALNKQWQDEEEKSSQFELNFEQIRQLNYYLNDASITQAIKNGGGSITILKYFSLIANQIQLNRDDIDQKLKISYEQYIKDYLLSSDFYDGNGNLVLNNSKSLGGVADHKDAKYNRDGNFQSQPQTNRNRAGQIGSIGQSSRGGKIDLAQIASQYNIPQDILIKVIGSRQSFNSTEEFIQTALQVLASNRSSSRFATPSIRRITENSDNLSSTDKSKALEFIIKNIAFQALADKARTISEVDAINRAMRALTLGLANKLGEEINDLNLIKALNSLANNRSVQIISSESRDLISEEGGSQVPFSKPGQAYYNSEGFYVGPKKPDPDNIDNNPLIGPKGLEGAKKDAPNATGSNTSQEINQQDQNPTTTGQDQAPQAGGINQSKASKQTSTADSSNAQNSNQSPLPNNSSTQTTSNQAESKQSSSSAQSSSAGIGSRLRNPFKNPFKKSNRAGAGGGGQKKSPISNQVDQLKKIAIERAKQLALSTAASLAPWIIGGILFIMIITVGPAMGMGVSRILYCEEPIKSDLVVIAGRTAFDLASGRFIPDYIWRDCIQECLQNGGTVTDAKGTPCQQKRITGGGVNVANVGTLLNVGTEAQNANLLYIMLATKWQETGGFGFDYGANDNELSDLDSCGPYQQRMIELGYRGNPILAGVVQQLIGIDKYNEFFSESNPNMVNIYALEDRRAQTAEFSPEAAKVCKPLQQYLKSTNNLGMWDYLFYERIKNENRLDEVLNASKSTNFTDLVEKIQRGVPKPGIDQFKEYLYDNNVYNEIKALCGSSTANTTQQANLDENQIRNTLLASKEIKNLNQFASLFKGIQAFRSNNINVNAQEVDYNNWLNISGAAFDNGNFLAGKGKFTQFNEQSGGNNTGGIDISFGNISAGISDVAQANGFPLFASLGEGVVVHTVTGVASGLNSSFGNRVSIYYPNYNPNGVAPSGIIVDYSHLNAVNVTVGQKVNSSTLFGTQGNSGSVRPPTGFYQTDIALIKASTVFKNNYDQGNLSALRTDGRLTEIERTLTNEEALTVYSTYLNDFLKYYQSNKLQIDAGIKSGTYSNLSNTTATNTPGKISSDCAPVCQEGTSTTEGSTNTSGQTATGENFIGPYTDDRPKINAKYTILHYTAISETEANRNALKGGGPAEGGAHFGITSDGLLDTYVPLDTLAEGTFFYSRIYDDSGRMQLPPIPKDDSAKDPSKIRVPFQTRYGEGRDSVDLQSIQYEVYYKPQAYVKGQTPSGTISDAQLKTLAQSITKLGHAPNKIFTHWGVQPQQKSDPWDWIPPEGRVTPKLLQFVKYMQAENAAGWTGDPNTIAKDIVKRNIQNAIRVIEDDNIGYTRPYTTSSADGGTDYSSDRYQNVIGSPATLKAELAKLNNQADSNQDTNLAQNIIDSVFGGIEADAAGTRPTKYDDLTPKHLEFLDTVAKEAGYTKKYRDANLNDTGTDLQSEAKTAFTAFKNLVREETGIDVKVLSGYRSRNAQISTFFNPTKEIQIIYDENQANDSPTNLEAKRQYLARAKSSAPPGYSEHHTGYAFDYWTEAIPTTGNLDRNNWPPALENIVNNPANLTPLGLKLSYPKNSTNGAEYEPWHLLFIGKDGVNPITLFEEGGSNTNANGTAVDPCKFTNRGISNLTDPFVTEGTITSLYGPRYGRQHEGIDIAILSDPNPPIIALEDGIVEYADYQTPGDPSDGYGKLVIINHPGAGLQTAYAHLDEFKVKKGQEVKKGSLLGYMGCTGRTLPPPCGIHIHFEIRKLDPGAPPGTDGVAFDPCTVLNCKSGIITPPTSVKDQYDSLRRK